MQVQSKIKSDLKRWANSDFVRNLSRHFSDYEVRVKEVVRDFDLRSRDAREKSRQQIDKIAEQIKRTRSKVEEKVSTILNSEGQRLNGRVKQVFNYIRAIAQSEKINGRAGAKKIARRATNGRASARKKAKKKTTRRVSAH